MKKITSSLTWFFTLYTLILAMLLVDSVHVWFHPTLAVLIPAAMSITLSLRKMLHKKDAWLLLIWTVLFALSVGLYEWITRSGWIASFATLYSLLIMAGFAWLASGVVTALGRVEEKLNNADAPGRVILLHQANSRIQAEFIRAKRYNYPVAVMVLEPVGPTVPLAPAGEPVTQINHARRTKLVQHIGDYLLLKLRSSDLVIRDNEQNNLLLICPINQTENIDELANRISSIIRKDLGVEVSIKSRSFPDDGPVFEVLYQSMTE